MLRAQRLASWIDAEVTYYYVDRSVSKIRAIWAAWQFIKSDKWDLVYQEGTGITGGLSLIAAALLRKQPFVVSGGDPIAGFFRTTQGALVGNLFEIYERLLYRCCAGYIGWTPYLTGVALKLGAKKAVTVEGGADTTVFYPYSPSRRAEVRQKLGLNPDHIVCGVVGSLIWVAPQSYCYGYELVEILKLIQRQNVSFLIVGDGDGRNRLEQAVPAALKSRVVFTGKISEAEVVDAINAMDIGFVTLFGEMGKFRLTTKLPEYTACGISVAMSPQAGFYDYISGAGWALPDVHPASVEFHKQVAKWLDRLSVEELQDKKQQSLKVTESRFDYRVVGFRFRQFIHDLLELNQTAEAENAAVEEAVAEKAAFTSVSSRNI